MRSLPFSFRSAGPVAAAFLTVALGAPSAFAQTFAPGDLVVSAYGTPTSTGLIDGQAVPISLQVFSSSTTATGETPLSVTVLNGIVGEYGSSSEGNIQMTGNGQDLTIAGYNATEAAQGIGEYTADKAPGETNGNYPGDNGDSSSSSWKDDEGQPYGGTAASGATASTSTEVPLAQSSPIDVARVADVLNLNGNVVSSTSFSNIYNTNNARSAYSATGSSIYISGQGDNKSDGDEGIFYSPTTGTPYSGTTTSTLPPAIYNSNDTRYVTGYNGNLYYSLDKKNNPTGIFMYTGMPTSLSTAATQLTLGINTASGYANTDNSPEAFWFANSTTLYVADTGIPKVGGSAVGAGGIQKWTLSGGTWSLQYVLTPSNFVSPTLAANASSGQTGFEAITGQVINGTVDLYAVSYTAGDDNPNGLYAIADPLAATTAGSDAFTELAASPGDGDENFKGVALVTPEPSTWGMLLGGWGLLVFWRKRARRLQA